MINNNKVVYSINVEDLQTISKRQLGRMLTDLEIESVEDKLADCIDWQAAIANAIECCLDDHLLIK